MESEGAAEGLGGESAALGEEALDWEEAHRRGLTPVLRICVGDVELVHEAPDESDSDACSSDSNAEGHFGNDYGDEDSYGSGEDEDQEAGWRGRGRGGTRGWYDDDEEYGSDDGSY
ncbi:hypothetical protein H632_c3540p1 [Helicosporidium sp. ATCC 50920]|nr:hypothetical protein H632_c3540p1 [Helicosporidium sp. ATCC 50920]|eukprot:KDD72305.1 hypothetical protein H632_c3540p1 [Helicosporidium sp. ATCC 50920]